MDEEKQNLRDLEIKYVDRSNKSKWRYKDPNLVVLDSDRMYDYGTVHIESGCTLTVHPWKGRDIMNAERNQELKRDANITPYSLELICAYWQNKQGQPTATIDIQTLILTYISSVFTPFVGGRLLLKCNTLIIDAGARLHADMCGYTSGSYYRSGESSHSLGELQSREANGGGGGAATDSVSGGGGAGYGTKGLDGKPGKQIDSNSPQFGYGGNVYGDKYLRRLLLGSGGGGGLRCNGGNGGGAIYIECNRLRLYGSITSNGGDAEVGSGAGSGGSIHIVAKQSVDVDKTALIQAKGGLSGKWGLYANGGHGRIRVDVHPQQLAYLQNFVSTVKRINPIPYVAASDD